MADYDLTLLGKIIWEDRYALKDESGNLKETSILDTFRRVAKAIASKEKDPAYWEEKFYDLMANKYFCPAGRVLAHAGTHYSQLLNCFVLPFENDSLEAIMDTAKNMAITQKFGGGVGFNYSSLRPAGSHIKGVNGHSCGVMGFMHMMSTTSEVIEQGGCLTKDTLLNTDRGLLYFSEIIKESSKGWYDHNLNVSTKEGITYPSKRYYVNGFDKTLSIVTKLGTEITGTLDHKLQVFTDKGFVWKQIKDINKKDFLVYKLNQHKGETQNLFTCFDKTHHNCIIPEKLPEQIDEFFAYFLGYFLGNGFSTVAEKDYRIGVTIPDKSFLSMLIADMFKKLFGDNISVLVSKKPDDESTTYYISNKIIKQYLRDNGLLKCKSIDASVPQKIRCSTGEVLGSFLGGLFEADGAISHGYPQLNTSSYKLAKEIQVLLFGLGIPNKLKRGFPKDSFSNKEKYFIRVISFKGLENWNKYVRVNDSSRFIACKSFKPDMDREQSYILPNSNYWVGGLLEKLKSKDCNFPEKNKIIKRVKRYLRNGRNLTYSSYNRLIQECKSFYAFPTVDDFLFTEVDTLSEGENDTYDIEVDDSHSYLANSLVSHNSRRGASLGLLEVWHPDIWEFISYKAEHHWDRLTEFMQVQDEKKWNEFKFENLHKLQMYNISVGITDEFLQAVKRVEYWPLIWAGVEWELYNVKFKKHQADGTYNQESFEVVADCNKTALWKVRKKIPFPTGKDIFEVRSKRKITALELWDKICHNAWADGCPGIINLSTARKMHNIEYVHPLTSANPCAEQMLPSYSSCNLSSFIISSYVTDGAVDWVRLEKDVYTAIRFADSVIDNCEFPLSAIKEKAQKERRIGLGVMGVHDFLIKLGLAYDSQKGRDAIEGVLVFIRDAAYRASISIAQEKGSFPVFDKERILESLFIKALPADIKEDIYNKGLRNSTLLSIAPNGTIGAMLNSSTGCEPWFSLSFQRSTRLGSYEDGCPIYIQWKKENPNKEIPDYFKTAQEISPDDHIKMLILFSKYCDSSVSKTINLPNSAIVDDVKRAFMFAMDNGVKGITVFRDGSKEGVLKDKKDKVIEEAKKIVSDLQHIEDGDSRINPKTRGNRVCGATTRVHMQSHNLYVTVNKNPAGEMVEVFATVGTNKKHGAHHTSGVENSWAQGLAKTISLALRAGVKISSIIRNLKNIPSDKPVFCTIGDCESSELIPSPPHAIARILEEEDNQVMSKPVSKVLEDLPDGRICDECGSKKTHRKSSTCYTCLSCGHEQCG